MLLVAMASSILALCITQPMGKNIHHPRPFVMAQDSFRYDGGELMKAQPLAFRAPLAGMTHEDLAKLEAGEASDNDLGSFPSDHAAFFFSLALGIWFASRAAGALALGWTLVVILTPRIVSGQHWPLDVAAGMGIGTAVLLALHFVLRGRRGRWLDPVAAWTIRHSALASAFLFLFLYAAVNALADVKDGLGVAKDIAKSWIGM
jgi:membrane-associated phospholipid phosphatase